MKSAFQLPKRGMTFIEVLIAAAITAGSLAGMVSMWYFIDSMAVQTSDKAISYSLARQAMEKIKQTGFYNTAEQPTSAPTVHYYDAAETLQDATPTKASFKVSTTVVSDLTVTGKNPVTPADNAIRAVQITVNKYPSGTLTYQLNTYLVRAGI